MAGAGILLEGTADGLCVRVYICKPDRLYLSVTITFLSYINITTPRTHTPRFQYTTAIWDSLGIGAGPLEKRLLDALHGPKRKTSDSMGRAYKLAALGSGAGGSQGKGHHWLQSVDCLDFMKPYLNNSGGGGVSYQSIRKHVSA